MNKSQRTRTIKKGDVIPLQVFYKGEKINIETCTPHAFSQIKTFKEGNLFDYGITEDRINLQRRKVEPCNWLIVDYKVCKITFRRYTYTERCLELFFSSKDDTRKYFDALVGKRDIKDPKAKRNEKRKYRKSKKLDPKKLKLLAMSDNITCPILRKTLMGIS